MAAFSSASSSSATTATKTKTKTTYLPFPSHPKSFPARLTVPPELFKQFHKIDRTIFTRLIFILNRHPAETLKVVALCLLLEHSGQSRNLINNMLKWNDAQVLILYDEGAMCISCIEHDAFPIPCPENYFLRHHIPLIQAITKDVLNLIYFHDNRAHVLRSVTKIVNKICVPAFEDLLARHREPFSNSGFDDFTYNYTDFNYNVDHNNYNNCNNVNIHGNYGPTVVNGELTAPVVTNEHSFFQDFDGYARRAGVGMSMKFLEEFEDELGITNLEADDYHYQELEKIVVAPLLRPPADDRTIFLTFSKGYPVSENEVRDFFTGKFGDCIEAIYMQEVVTVFDQPLFARLVVEPGAMETILEGKGRAKFSINGKHVRARKYVRKNPGSPPQASSPVKHSTPVRRAVAYSAK